MQSGEQPPISELNLFLFSPASLEIEKYTRQRLALEYIAQFGGPGKELSSTLLFATGIHPPFSASTLPYAKAYSVMPEIWELKTRLNFCLYLVQFPGKPVRTFDQLEAQENEMQSRRADLLRQYGERIAIIEDPFFIDVSAGCIRQYTLADRAKILATFQSMNRHRREIGQPHVNSDPQVIGVLFFFHLLAIRNGRENPPLDSAGSI